MIQIIKICGGNDLDNENVWCNDLDGENVWW